jgi:hypothetical protein
MIVLKSQSKLDFQEEQISNVNPLKGTGKGPISESVSHRIERAITEFVTYDAETTDSLRDFERIKSRTECIFAKRAKIWGSPNWNKTLSLDENIFRMLPTFLKFVICCETVDLDGFVIQLPEELSLDMPVSKNNFESMIDIINFLYTSVKIMYMYQLT